MATMKEEGAVPDFLRMDLPVLIPTEVARHSGMISPAIPI